MPMETLSTAMNRLYADGYTDSFRVEKGALFAVDADEAFAPDQLRVDAVVRFEGTSDPGDEAILFALSVPAKGIRGTWAASYGPSMPPEEAAMARRLDELHTR